MCLRTLFREETYRDAEGRLTRFKTERRFVYIDIPKTPLPKSMKIGPNFLGFLYYREQEAGKDEGKTTATQPGSGQAHDQCPCSGDLVAQPHTDPDVESKNTHETLESTEENNYNQQKGHKQPSTGLKQAAKDQQDTSRSLATKGN